MNESDFPLYPPFVVLLLPRILQNPHSSLPAYSSSSYMSSIQQMPPRLDWNPVNMAEEKQEERLNFRKVPPPAVNQRPTANLVTFDWWIGALSMTIIECGPGNRLQSGRGLFSTNSSKVSMVYEPCLMSHAIKPLTAYAGKRDYRSERLKDLDSWGVIPTSAQPYLRSPVRSFAADSSTRISWSAVQSATLRRHAGRSSGFRWAARICIYQVRNR